MHAGTAGLLFLRPVSAAGAGGHLGRRRRFVLCIVVRGWECDLSLFALERSGKLGSRGVRTRMWLKLFLGSHGLSIGPCK